MRDIVGAKGGTASGAPTTSCPDGPTPGPVGGGRDLCSNWLKKRTCSSKMEYQVGVARCLTPWRGRDFSTLSIICGYPKFLVENIVINPSLKRRGLVGIKGRR